jgi:hypothetical protein
MGEMLPQGTELCQSPLPPSNFARFIDTTDVRAVAASLVVDSSTNSSKLFALF